MSGAPSLRESPRLLAIVSLCALGACSDLASPSNANEWRVVGYIGANNDARIMQDPGGCFWFATLKDMKPLLDGSGGQRCLILPRGPASPRKDGASPQNMSDDKDTTP